MLIEFLPSVDSFAGFDSIEVRRTLEALNNAIQN
jgi:hypothetical protein